MFVTIDGIKVFYQRHFGNGIPVLLLHGWGANKEAMSVIFDYLARKDRNVISVDMPGFGESDLPNEHFGIYDYAKLTAKFVTELSIDSVIIVGHSFGGRIAILLAAETDLVERIVLVDSAGMKPRRKLSYYINVFKYKRAKKKKRDLSGYGSADYKALSPVMKSVFTRVVNCFLEKELKKISCPALIVWGENDADTPMYMARRLKRGIKDSGLVVLKNCEHFSYLEDSGRFNIILSEFIKWS